MGAPGACMGGRLGTRKMCRSGSWGQLPPMLHLTRGCPLILLQSTHLPPFSFLFPTFLFKPRAAACRASFAMGMPPPRPNSPPFLTRSKEVSGVTVSTACRLSAPPPPIQKALPSLSRLRRPSPRSLLFIWQGRHPLISRILHIMKNS